MSIDTARKPRRYSDTEAARAASRATFARRRAEKAVAELLAQGNTVIVIGRDGEATTYRP